MLGVIPTRLGPEVLAELDCDQTGYSNVYGNANLRDQIVLAHQLNGIGIAPSNVLTTFGANHALDLVIRRFLSEGQTVLVDDPVRQAEPCAGECDRRAAHQHRPQS